MVPESPEPASPSTTSALIHTGLLSVGLSNLFWKGSEISANPDDRVLILAMGLFCLAIPFQGLYILLSRMIREYDSSAKADRAGLYTQAGINLRDGELRLRNHRVLPDADEDLDHPGGGSAVFRCPGDNHGQNCHDESLRGQPDRLLEGYSNQIPSGDYARGSDGLRG